MLYFAYGSLMEWSEMRNLCPKFITIAKLLHHDIKFTQWSRNRKCGVANIVFDKTESIWGVVYEIGETEIGLLDKREGFRPGRDLAVNSYVREERHVLRDGDEDQPLLVSVYVGNKPSIGKEPPLPNAAYKKLLVDGATNWRLPSDYIEKLKRFKTAETSIHHM